ncbi:MAG: BON domain-containing protein [Gemmatimonadaceae bacterium]|nr:BON domain-containing protein [Gemmatimonadaceae bacterium]
MARESHTRTADRESTRGFEPQRRHAQYADDRQGENDDVYIGRERSWQQDDGNSSYGQRNRSSEDQYQGDGYQRDRGRFENRDRQRGRSDWEPYDRNPTNYSQRYDQRNDAYGQADGGGFGGYDSQYGQNYSQNYGQNYADNFGSPMHRQSNSPGYPSYGGRTVAPTNGPWRGMQDNQYYGDTQGDNYGGGAYMRSRENRSRSQDFYNQQSRRDSGNYGSEFMEDGFGSLRSRQREGNGYSNGYSSGSSSSESQNYSGRGPKGWKRSDERIQEELSEQLERHWSLDASEIEVKVKDGEVTLTGTTSDRQMKRLAEDIADEISGVREVQNQIRVQRADGARDSDRRSNNESADSKQQGRKSTPMTS